MLCCAQDGCITAVTVHLCETFHTWVGLGGVWLWVQILLWYVLCICVCLCGSDCGLCCVFYTGVWGGCYLLLWFRGVQAVVRYSTCFPSAQSQARVTPNHTSPLSTNFTPHKTAFQFYL